MVSHNHSSLRENKELQVNRWWSSSPLIGHQGSRGAGFEINVKKNKKQGSPQKREGCSWCTVTNLHSPHRRLEPLLSLFSPSSFFWGIIFFLLLFLIPHSLLLQCSTIKNQTCCLSPVRCFLLVTWRQRRSR